MTDRIADNAAGTGNYIIGSDTSAFVSNATFEQMWSSVLRDTIEIWIHQILFVRQVYPKHTFTRSLARKHSAFLSGLNGIIYVNEHPSVASYIQKVLQVSVPSILAIATAELNCSIIDRPNNEHYNSSNAADRQSYRILETYSIRISSTGSTGDKNKNSDELVAIERLHQIETGMKNLILSIHTALKYSIPPLLSMSESKRQPPNLDTLSFQLSLFVPPRCSTTSQATLPFFSSPELEKEIAIGTWRARAADPIIQNPTNIPNNTNRIHQILYNDDNEEDDEVNNIVYVKEKHQSLSYQQAPTVKCIRPIHSYSDDFIGKTFQFSYLADHDNINCK